MISNTIKLHGKSFQSKLLKVYHVPTFLQTVNGSILQLFFKLLHGPASTLLAFNILQSLEINTGPRRCTENVKMKTKQLFEIDNRTKCTILYTKL